MRSLRKSALCGAVVLAVSNGACLTASVVSKDSTYTQYDELSSFLVAKTNETPQVVVVGQKNHYFIPLTPELEAIIASPLRPQMRLSFQKFELDAHDRVKVSYQITANPTPEQFTQLRALRFVLNSQQWVYGATAEGRRYDAGRYRLPEALKPFATPIKVSITTKDKAAFVKKLVLTPLAMAGDVAIGVVALPIAVVAGPLVVL